MLLFAYFYPPLGGPAVQRPCKTVKYLARQGWQTDVITVGDIVYHSRDKSLPDECRHSKVFRTPSLDPMYLLNKLRSLLHLNTDRIYFGTSSSRKRKLKHFFPIDDKIGWALFAYRAGKKALLANRYLAVMVTCGPFSSILAARRIAKLGGLPLILDYRDHWTLSNIAVQPKGVVYRLLQRLEKKCLQSAGLILTATGRMKQDLIREFGAELEGRIMPFFNGWDEEDFIGKTRQRTADGRIRICYIGAFYGQRSLTPLLEAFRQVSAGLPDAGLEFWFIGNFYPETHREAQACGAADRITFIGQQPHAQAIQLMLDADILVLVIGGSEYNWVLSGKLFEYLRTRQPILALIAPDSEAAEILSACGHRDICPIDDANAIRTCLEQLISKHRSGQTSFTIPIQYERGQQVRNLAERLQRITC